jgi:flagellar L-ring protein FlgH
MTQLRYLIIVALTLVCVFPVSADSLWKANTESQFADRKASKVGDILSIIVVETSTATHEVSRDSKKKVNGSASAGSGLLDFIRPFGASSERSASGSGNATQSTNLVDRITVQVVEVLPNGLLRIKGQRTVQLQPDKMSLILTGLVRGEDVTPDNTVASTKIAELTIVSNGKGPIADTQKPGILSRILRLLW